MRLFSKLASLTLRSELPLNRLTELFNANNYLVSHVPSYWSWQPASDDLSDERRWLLALAHFAETEITHRMDQLKTLGLLPSLINSLMDTGRPFQGDVLITPAVYCSDIRHIVSNPTPEFIRLCVKRGERAVWRRMSQIEMRCAIEFAIDDILDQLRRRQSEDGGNNKGRAPLDPAPVLRRVRSLRL